MWLSELHEELDVRCTVGPLLQLTCDIDGLMFAVVRLYVVMGVYLWIVESSDECSKL